MAWLQSHLSLWCRVGLPSDWERVLSKCLPHCRKWYFCLVTCILTLFVISCFTKCRLRGKRVYSKKSYSKLTHPGLACGAEELFSFYWLQSKDQQSSSRSATGATEPPRKLSPFELQKNWIATCQQGKSYNAKVKIIFSENQASSQTWCWRGWGSCLGDLILLGVRYTKIHLGNGIFSFSRGIF